MSTDDLYGWGIDVGLDTTAICAYGGGDDIHFSLPRCGLGSLPERLDVLMADVETRAGQLCSDCPPGLVLVEKPTGRFLKPPLLYACGVITTALHRALKDRMAFPVSVVGIGVSEWKKASLGFGNASKEQIMSWALEGWPALDGISQDEADALGIAVMAYESIVSSESAVSS